MEAPEGWSPLSGHPGSGHGPTSPRNPFRCSLHSRDNQAGRGPSGSHGSRCLCVKQGHWTASAQWAGAVLCPHYLAGACHHEKGPQSRHRVRKQAAALGGWPSPPTFHVLPPGLGRVDSWVSEAWSWTGDGDAQQTVQRTLAELRPQPKETHSQQALGT